jgi:tetratricopeptide (TPR) repeat protein
MARMISGKLRIKLSGVQEQQLTKRGTNSPEAHDLVLKGDFLFQKSTTLTKALEFYRQAAALDPNYALAYARIAASYQKLGGNSMVDPKEVLPNVRVAAQKAIELDRNLPDAHYVLAEIARDSWDWTTAEREYKRALELNPNLSWVHLRYSSFLSDMGRHGEAIAEAGRLRELDPQQMSSHGTLFGALMVARRYDESIAQIKKSLEMHKVYGSYALLGNAYAGKGDYGASIIAYKEAIRLGSKQTYHLICLGAAYAGAGEREKARAVLKQLETRQEYVSPGELAILYAALGDQNRAFAALEKAYAAHDLQLQHLNADQGFDPLRDDARFKNLVRSVGLPL